MKDTLRRDRIETRLLMTLEKAILMVQQEKKASELRKEMNHSECFSKD